MHGLLVIGFNLLRYHCQCFLICFSSFSFSIFQADLKRLLKVRLQGNKPNLFFKTLNFFFLVITNFLLKYFLDVIACEIVLSWFVYWIAIGHSKFYNECVLFRSYFLFLSLIITLSFVVKSVAGGRNVDDQNVDRPKISERRNGLFSWSERRKSKNHFRRCDHSQCHR